MQVALWVIIFTIVYAIITLVALVANSEHKGPKISNALGLPILIVLYLIALPIVIDAARDKGNTTSEDSYVGVGSSSTSDLSNSSDKENNTWGSRYGNENIRKSVRDEMIRNGSDPNMADAYTKLKFDEEQARNQRK